MLLTEWNLKDALEVAREEEREKARKEERDILLYFLKERSSEVENMLLTEWNLKDALEVAREEAREEEREKALKEGREKERAELFTLWESGVSLEDAKRQLGRL